jgi:hypothetical protein
LPIDFVRKWYMELRASNLGWIKLPNGNLYLARMYTTGLNQYMESGIQVALRCGFTVPMRVKLHYLVEANKFKMDVLGLDGQLGKSMNNPLVISDDDNNNSDLDFDVESDDDPDDVDGIEEDDSDADSDDDTDDDDTDGDWLHRDLDPYLCKVYNWRRVVSKALAWKKKPQALVCSASLFNHMLTSSSFAVL